MGLCREVQGNKDLPNNLCCCWQKYAFFLAQEANSTNMPCHENSRTVLVRYPSDITCKLELCYSKSYGKSKVSQTQHPPVGKSDPFIAFQDEGHLAHILLKARTPLTLKYIWRQPVTRPLLPLGLNPSPTKLSKGSLSYARCIRPLHGKKAWKHSKLFHMLFLGVWQIKALHGQSSGKPFTDPDFERVHKVLIWKIQHEEIHFNLLYLGSPNHSDN